MAKKSSRKPDVAKPRKQKGKLPALTGNAQDVFRYVLNNIAFQNYRDCCALDDIAEHFGKTPGRLKPALRKLVDAGYVTTSGDIVEVVYPTVAALRKQDPHLSEAQAEALLRKVRRA